MHDLSETARHRSRPEINPQAPPWQILVESVAWEQPPETCGSLPSKARPESVRMTSKVLSSLPAAPAHSSGPTLVTWRKVPHVLHDRKAASAPSCLYVHICVRGSSCTLSHAGDQPCLTSVDGGIQLCPS